MDNNTGPSFLDNVHHIVPITFPYIHVSDKEALPYRLSRTALPFRLGFATTIHKIQGQTCDKVVFNPTNLHSCALAYVALSRVRLRTYMCITAPLDSSQLHKPDRAITIDAAEDKKIVAIMQRLEFSTCQLVSRMQFVADTNNRDALLNAALL